MNPKAHTDMRRPSQVEFCGCRASQNDSMRPRAGLLERNRVNNSRFLKMGVPEEAYGCLGNNRGLWVGSPFGSYIGTISMKSKISRARGLDLKSGVRLEFGHLPYLPGLKP